MDAARLGGSSDFRRKLTMDATIESVGDAPYLLERSPRVDNMRGVLGVVAALGALAFVASGVSAIFTIPLSKFAWALAHSVTPFLAIPLLFAPMMFALLGALVAAWQAYGWVAVPLNATARVDLGEPQAAPRRRPSALLLGLCVAATLGHAWRHAHLPRVPVLQKDLVLVKGLSSPTNPVLIGDTIYWIKSTPRAESSRTLA